MSKFSLPAVVRELKRRLPLRHPVTITRLNRKAAREFWGEADLVKRRNGSKAFVIRLFRKTAITRQERAMVYDSLIHEWAHCRAWPRGREKFHSDRWGREYSKAYRATKDNS